MQLVDWTSPTFKTQLLIAQKAPWMIDAFSIERGVTNVKGWFIAFCVAPDTVRFLANDNLLIAPSIDHYDANLQNILIPALPDAAYRFSLTYPAPREVDFHSLKFLPSGSIDSADIAISGWYLMDPARDDDPVPEGENIYRVIASSGTEMFRLGGATVANRIDAYLRQTRGKSLADIGTVLDWGCGCARVSRYFRKLGCQALYGVDVDQTNVAWCKDHLGWFQAQLSGLSPPLPFADQTFDLIVGISIFTHLREPAQFAWLEELARVLKPGGICFVTIMREGQVALQNGGAEMVSVVTTQGYVVYDDNDQLKLGDTDDNYYVNVYHSAHYIFEHWRRYFNVLDIVPFIAAHQDAVILERW